MKKTLSIFLSILIIASAIVAIPAFAADKSYKAGSEVTLNFLANVSDTKICCLEGEISFGEQLSIVENSVIFPHVGDMYNKVSGNKVLFNATNIDEQYDFGEDKIVASAKFTVNEDVSELPVACVLDEFFYYKLENNVPVFVVPDGITLPYTLKTQVEGEPEETTGTPEETSEPITTSAQGTTSTQETTSAQETTEAKETTESTASNPTEDTSATQPESGKSSSETVETTQSTESTEATTSTTPTGATVEPTEPESTTATEATTAAPAKKATKKANPIKVTVSNKSVKAKTLKKKAVILKVIKVKKAKGKYTIIKVKKGTTKKIYRKVVVGKTSGKIKLKKGQYSKGTIKIAIKVKVNGNSTYKSKTVTKKLKIKIK